jgi:ribonuclease BN (tRNA processing enzyme)
LRGFCRMQTANGVRLTFVGSGDAFGSGGRFHTCFMVEAPDFTFLIDCGVSSPIALKKLGVDSAVIDAVVVSHLHGDHFGGIPYLVLDGHYVSNRTKPLTVAGPAGVKERVTAATDVLYPGVNSIERVFAIEYVELHAGESSMIGPVTVVPREVPHGGGAPSHALRVEVAGKTVAYTGDAGWTDELLKVAGGADILICEAFFYEGDATGHLSYRTLLERRADLNCKRMILTHMGKEVLDRLNELEIEAASDGQTIDL